MNNPLIDEIERFSSLIRLRRIFAWIIRFLNNSQARYNRLESKPKLSGLYLILDYLIIFIIGFAITTTRAYSMTILFLDDLLQLNPTAEITTLYQREKPPYRIRFLSNCQR